MIRAILRFLWYIFWFFFLYKIISFFTKRGIKRDSEVHEEREKSVKKARAYRDPVCGTFVDPSIALTITYKGEKIYFCSKECRDKFLEGE